MTKDKVDQIMKRIFEWMDRRRAAAAASSQNYSGCIGNTLLWDWIDDKHIDAASEKQCVEA